MRRASPTALRHHHRQHNTCNSRLSFLSRASSASAAECQRAALPAAPVIQLTPNPKRLAAERGNLLHDHVQKIQGARLELLEIVSKAMDTEESGPESADPLVKRHSQDAPTPLSQDLNISPPPVESQLQAVFPPYPYPSLPLLLPPNDNQLIEPIRAALLRPLIQAIHDGELETAWSAYQDIHSQNPKAIRVGYLHGLFGLIISVAKKTATFTRTDFHRMSELVFEIRRRGVGKGKVREWEWNSYMAAAAKGFRVTTRADYYTALGILEEWMTEVREMREWEAGVAGTGQTMEGTRGGQRRSLALGKPTKFAPTISTFNILIGIASRTGDASLFEDAHARMTAFEDGALRPDRITFLSRITYYRRSQRLDLIPRVLKQMLARDLVIGTDGANAVVWAYAREGSVGVAHEIYDVLMRNERQQNQAAETWPFRSSTPRGRSFVPKPKTSWYILNPVLRIPGVVKALRNVTPDVRTHTMMMQAFAYERDLEQAFTVLQNYMDHLRRQSSGRHRYQSRFGGNNSKGLSGGGGGGVDMSPDSTEVQLIAAFLGLFRSFTEHGASPARKARTQKQTPRVISLKDATAVAVRNLGGTRATDGALTEVPHEEEEDDSPFTLDALLYVFDTYMTISASHPLADNRRLPGVNFVREILRAFVNTGYGEDSDENRELLRQVWQKLVHERLAVCGQEWEEAKGSWKWIKVRRDFDILREWEAQDG